MTSAPTPADRAVPRPVLREIAHLTRRSDVWPGAMATQLTQRLAPILHNEATRSYAYSGDLYAVFEEMEDKDGHYFAVLQTRKQGLLARPWRLLPAEDGPPAEREAALSLARRALARLGDLRRNLLEILDALGKGVAVLEVAWEVAPDGAVLPRALVARRPGRFRFEADESLRRIDPGDPPEGVAMPDRKFLVARFQPQYGQAAGIGLAARAYWYSWFKRNNLKSWALYNEKFGAPTIVARLPVGADSGERQRLLEVIEALHQDAGIALPEDVRLDLLEASRGGSADTYRALAEWCNDEISKIVLGQTLTTGEGQRSGSLALGRVHAEIRHEYIQADAAMLEGAVGTLLRWIVDFNLGPDVPAPLWRIDTRPADELQRNLQLDSDLIGLGLPLGVDYFYERYGRPRPADGSAVINYDDRNIFQYHLRFGVLTINEVRARMGLPPVPWGSERANASFARDGAEPAGTAAVVRMDPNEAAGRSREEDAAEERTEAERDTEEPAAER